MWSYRGRLSFFIVWAWGWAQKSYFQQRVEYYIQVRLEPQNHILRGFYRLRYKNNSPDTLTGLYMHLSPNAYSRRGTAFDRQQRLSGKAAFYFAAEGDRGFMDSLDFHIGGEKIKPLPAKKGPPPAIGHSRTVLKHAPDVVWLPFPKPLPPGETIQIETPFRVKVPKLFSRMGRDGVEYAITQWYPKPAVYDRYGWHPLPYLDQGEFYGEWGKYEVEIEVPENFLVAATGRLETPQEHEWLRQRETETRRWIDSAPSPAKSQGSRTIKLPFVRIKLPNLTDDSTATLKLPDWASSTSIAPRYKRLRFVQDSVHDFAWFCDPRYGLISDTITLSNGHRVACVSVFPLSVYLSWQHAPNYIAEAIQTLSKSVGPYPYTHATAVAGGLEAGGGMEYPMITIIIPTKDTATLRQIVVHEVGHNWFQGLLGSNERLHPWQDEGVNSYYERRILSGKPTPEGTSLQVQGLMMEGVGISPVAAAYHHLNADVAPAASAYRHSLLSYGLGVYDQTSSILSAAVFAFTPERWDAGMQRYFSRWAFRHPYPTDWAESLEEVGLPGNALLRYLMTDRETDIKLNFRRLDDTTYQVHVKEPTAILPRPFAVEAMALSRKNAPLRTYRLPIDTSVVVSLPQGSDVFVINPTMSLYERRVGNNFFFTRGLLRSWRRVRFVSLFPKSLPQSHITHVGLFPALGYNFRDGLLIGLGAYHGLFPKRIGEFHLLPMYSLLRADWRGSGGLTFRAYPYDSPVQLVEMRLRTANFAGFWRTKASVELTFRPSYDRFVGRQVLRIRSHHLAFQDLERKTYSWLNEELPAYLAVDWEGRREEAILTASWMASVGHNLKGHPRVEAEGCLSWQLLRKWRLWSRLYAGWTSEAAPAYMHFRVSGFDPFGEAVLLDRFRESSSNLLRQQIVETQGGARFPTDTLFSASLLAANVEVPVPGVSILTLRADVGYFPIENRSCWGVSVGFPVIRFRDRLLAGGYFPVYGEAYAGRFPRDFRSVINCFVWSVQIPLDLRWAIPW
ncbi:MAG: M1 family metallopeptidase [Bacteroidia bacterium]|nr:M1 family metallopeptidase [Bacteroidia bacterium]